MRLEVAEFLLGGHHISTGDVITPKECRSLIQIQALIILLNHWTLLILQSLSYICWLSPLQLEGPKDDWAFSSAEGHFRCLCQVTPNALSSGRDLHEVPEKFSHFYSCLRWRDEKILSPMYQKRMMFSEWTHLCWGNLMKPDLVGKSLGSSVLMQTHLWGPQLKCLFLMVIISQLSGVRFQQQESKFSLTL